MTKQKKDGLLFINYNAYPCIVGGLEVFNLYLIDELSKDYPTHVLTHCDKNDHNKRVNVHFKKKLVFTRLSEPLQTFLFILKNKRRIKLIHISYTDDFWTHSYIYVIIKKLFKIEYALTIHDGNLGKWQPKWPFRAFFKNAYKITGVSDRIINEYAKRSKRSDIVFTPPLIPFNVLAQKNTFREKWGIEKDTIVILYVGSIKPLKSVDTLIDAFAILLENPGVKDKVKLVIAGDGSSRNEIEASAESKNLQAHIKFLGNVGTLEIPELYNLADIYTICSAYEGLPISTLEAFANRLPCVTSDSPGLINLTEDGKNTLTFKFKDEQDYAKKLYEVLSNNKLSAKLKENGHEYYQRLYSYEKLINKFKSIINKQ